MPLRYKALINLLMGCAFSVLFFTSPNVSVDRPSVDDCTRTQVTYTEAGYTINCPGSDYYRKAVR